MFDVLVFNPWRAVRPSGPSLFRKIEADRPTLLLDEIDAIWGHNARGDDEGLRAVLNAGFRRHASTVPRATGPHHHIHDFSTFCPKAFAGIGDLPDTIADRSIPIRMERKRRGDHAERCRWRYLQAAADPVRAQLDTTVPRLVVELGFAEPSLPDSLSDRAQDAWEPLLAIADAAGGKWPPHARHAAIELATGQAVEEPVSVQLLSHIREVFSVAEARKLSTAELVRSLIAIEDAPWREYNGKPLTPAALARLLRPYGIRPRHDRDWRGYTARDLEDAWDRYLPAPVTPVTPATGVGIRAPV